jgi:hypothetical protein
VKNGSCVLLSQLNKDVTQQLGRLLLVREVSASTSSWYKGIVIISSCLLAGIMILQDRHAKVTCIKRELIAPES